MKPELFPIILSCIAAVFGATANWLFKRAALHFVEIPIWKNWQLFLGLFCFGLVLTLFMTAFRNGGKLMTVYPSYATTYVWAVLIAFFVEGETITAYQILGAFAIIFGVTCIGLGART